jgi:hypothetical protein
MVDVVAYASVVPGEGDTPERYVAQLVAANGRYAKNRDGVLGKVADLDLAKWIEIYAKGAESKPKPASVTAAAKKEAA